MNKSDILVQITAKGAGLAAMADRLIKHSEQIPKLVEALQVEKSSKKYAYEKALRLVSEKRPELVYPYFYFFSWLLDSDNNFLKWGAIMTVANLTAVDIQGKFESVFRKFYAPIHGPTMITAANIIRSSVTIARSRPELADAVVGEILKAEKAEYRLKGVPSPECRNVAIGHAIDALDQLYEVIGSKSKVLNFVKRQLHNTRPPVVKRARQFIMKHKRA